MTSSEKEMTKLCDSTSKNADLEYNNSTRPRKALARTFSATVKGCIMKSRMRRRRKKKLKSWRSNRSRRK